MSTNCPKTPGFWCPLLRLEEEAPNLCPTSWLSQTGVFSIWLRSMPNRYKNLGLVGFGNFYVVVIPGKNKSKFSGQNHNLSLGTCEKVAENGALWELFSASFPPHPTRAPGRFNLFLGPRRQACKVSMSLHGRPWVTFSTHSPLPSPPRATNFGLLKLCPQNGPLSIYSAGHGWRYV